MVEYRKFSKGDTVSDGGKFADVVEAFYTKSGKYMYKLLYNDGTIGLVDEADLRMVYANRCNCGAKFTSDVHSHLDFCPHYQTKY